MSEAQNFLSGLISRLDNLENKYTAFISNVPSIKSQSFSSVDWIYELIESQIVKSQNQILNLYESNTSDFSSIAIKIFNELKVDIKSKLQNNETKIFNQQKQLETFSTEQSLLRSEIQQSTPEKQMPLQQNLYNSRLRHSASTVMKKPIKKDFSPVRSSRSRSPNPSTNSQSRRSNNTPNSTQKRDSDMYYEKNELQIRSKLLQTRISSLARISQQFMNSYIRFMKSRGADRRVMQDECEKDKRRLQFILKEIKDSNVCVKVEGDLDKDMYIQELVEQINELRQQNGTLQQLEEFSFNNAGQQFNKIKEQIQLTEQFYTLKLQEVQAKVSEFNEKVVDIEAKVCNGLQQYLQYVLKVEKNLELEGASGQSTLRAAEDSISQLTDVINSSEFKCTKLKQKIKNKTNLIDELQLKNAQLSGEIEYYQKIEGEFKEVQEYSKKILECVKQKDQIISQLQKKYNILKKSCKKPDNVSELCNEIVKAQESLSQLEQEYNQNRQYIDQCDYENQELKLQNKELKGKLESFQKYESHFDFYKQTYIEISSRIEPKAHSRVQSWNDIYACLQDEKYKNSDLLKQIEFLQKDLDEVLREKVRISSFTEGLIKDYDQQKNQLQIKLEKVNKKYHNLKKQGKPKFTQVKTSKQHNLTRIKEILGKYYKNDIISSIEAIVDKLKFKQLTIQTETNFSQDDSYQVYDSQQEFRIQSLQEENSYLHNQIALLKDELLQAYRRSDNTYDINQIKLKVLNLIGIIPLSNSHIEEAIEDLIKSVMEDKGEIARIMSKRKCK